MTERRFNISSKMVAIKFGAKPSEGGLLTGETLEDISCSFVMPSERQEGERNERQNNIE
jgi:hypothetical protein